MTAVAVDPVEQFEAVVAGDPRVDRHALCARLRRRDSVLPAFRRGRNVIAAATIIPDGGHTAL